MCDERVLTLKPESEDTDDEKACQSNPVSTAPKIPKSDYKHEREANIIRNNAFLDGLGLLKDKPVEEKKTGRRQRVRSNKKAKGEAATRQSERLKGPDGWVVIVAVGPLDMKTDAFQ